MNIESCMAQHEKFVLENSAHYRATLASNDDLKAAGLTVEEFVNCASLSNISYDLKVMYFDSLNVDPLIDSLRKRLNIDDDQWQRYLKLATKLYYDELSRIQPEAAPC